MEAGGFSIDQLMELAGLSVSQAGIALIIPIELFMHSLIRRIANPYHGSVYRVHPPEMGKNILVACGPGNNGKITSCLKKK